MDHSHFEWSCRWPAKEQGDASSQHTVVLTQNVFVAVSAARQLVTLSILFLRGDRAIQPTASGSTTVWAASHLSQAWQCSKPTQIHLTDSTLEIRKPEPHLLTPGKRQFRAYGVRSCTTAKRQQLKSARARQLASLSLTMLRCSSFFYRCFQAHQETAVCPSQQARSPPWNHCL